MVFGYLIYFIIINFVCIVIKDSLLESVKKLLNNSYIGC